MAITDEYFISSQEYLKFPDSLREAKEALDKGQFQDAESMLDKYLRKTDRLYWYGHGFYLMGRAKKLQEKWDEAIDYYRQAVEMGKKYDTPLMLSALYELSWLYERLQKYPEMISTLLDMSHQPPIHSRYITDIEIPARLAAGYVALNKNIDGLNYLKKARKAYQELANRIQFNGEEKSRIGVALFYMGLLPLLEITSSTYDKVKQELEVGQENILKVVEDDNSALGERSKVVLVNAYSFLWKNVKDKGIVTKGGHDQVKLKKIATNEQLVMASDIFDLIQALKGYSNPTIYASRQIKVLSKFLIELENEILNLVNEMSLGPELTAEAKKKILKLKTVNPNPMLEQKYLRLNKELTPGGPLPQKDPNL